MLTGVFRPYLLACALLALVGLSGCASPDEHVVVLRDWELVTAAGVHQPLVLPARVDQWLPHEPTVYRIRTHVELSPELRGKRLTLAFPQLHARATLTANGESMSGLVPEMDIGFRGTDQPRWRIPAEDTRSGKLDLEVGISYRMVMSGWLDAPPRLSDTDEGDAAFVAMADFNRTQAVTCFIAVLITSFTYAVIFALDRRRTRYGWFVLQGIVGGGGYAILVEGISQRLFGAYEHCFVPMFLCIGVVTSVEFSHAQFGLPRPSRLWWWVGIGVCAVLAATFSSPFVGPRIVPAWSCVMITANVAYQIPLAGRAWLTRGRPLAALVILLSWTALGVLGMPDLVTWAGLGELLGGLRAACWGFFLVAFLQSLVLSVEHHKTLGRADELNVELSRRLDALGVKNAEVLRLNDELRRQVGARADALALALAQASAPRASQTDEGRLRDLQPGEVVAKRYQVGRSVGEGATGKVYEVTRITDGARFALKLLDPRSDATEMARFAREAQIIAQMDHPNVIRIADVDVTHEGFFYLIVEFVEGLSLRHHYGRARSLAWNLRVLAQVAEGLAMIHARGIVHRDLKPANVLVTSAPDAGEKPLAKIADFGISSSGTVGAEAGGSEPSEPIALDAPLVPEGDGTLRTDRHSRSFTETDSLLTQTGAWLGTPKYMAPELGGDAKHARPTSDVFAFGVMAYELLVGAVPFEEPPAITRVKGDPFVRAPPVKAQAGALDPRVAELIDRCLADAPAERPEATELARALGSAVARLG